MNKKIMVIELLEMFFKKEKMPKRIKVGAFEFEYREELNAYFNINEKSSCEDLLENWFEDARQLNQEVEILEDNTEEIEELEKEQEAIANPKTMLQEIRFYYDSNKMGDKINEIIRYIKRKDKNND